MGLESVAYLRQPRSLSVEARLLPCQLPPTQRLRWLLLPALLLLSLLLSSHRQGLPALHPDPLAQNSVADAHHAQKAHRILIARLALADQPGWPSSERAWCVSLVAAAARTDAGS